MKDIYESEYGGGGGLELSELVNGPYIYRYSDGLFYKANYWNQLWNDDIIGIAVIDNDRKLIMSTDWKSYNYEDGVKYCSNYIFKNGKRGHLAKLNDHYSTFDYKYEIDVMLQLLNKSTIYSI